MRRLVVPALVAVLVAGAAGALVPATSGSAFCGSCHSMKAIHASWAESPHVRMPPGHTRAECVDCHVRPGPAGLLAAKLNGANEVLIEFTRPTPTTRVAAPHFLFAENCMACHPDVVARDGREKTRSGGLKEVGLRFPHGPHLAMAEYTPEMARRLAELEARGAERSGIEQEERSWLVRARRADCSACHGPAPRPGASVSRTGPAVNFRAENPMNCVFCHRGIGHGPATPAGPAVPPVANCAGCHTGRFHGTLGIVFEAQCFGGTDDAACLKCHPGIPRRLLKKLPLEK